MALSMFLMLFLFFSVSAIHAGDVNVTNVSSLNSSDDISLQIEDEIQIDDLETSNSSDLSKYSNNESLKENAKNKTELQYSTNSIYFKGCYEITLKDSNTNSALANQTVNFVINGAKYSSTTNAKGVASLKLSQNPGKYTVDAYFDGDESYESSNSTSQINILPTIKAKDVTKYYKGSAKYSATFFSSNGKALANRQVKITVNVKSYTKNTNGKGVASLDVNLKPGTYKVIATDPVTRYKLTTTFRILSTITSSDIKKVVGDSNKFNVKFFKSNGNPLANKHVKVKINGKTYWYKTSSKGNLFLSLNSFKKGTYKIVSYNTDGLTKTSTAKLYSIASTKLTTSIYTFRSNDTKQIKVKLTTVLGGNSNVGKTVKFTIDGSTFSKKTDSNGEAYLNLNSFGKGLYKVQYDFSGNKYFKNYHTTNFVTILGSTTPEFTVESGTDFGYGAKTPFKVALKADGVPLIKRKVTFTINGENYNVTTDNNGIASLPITQNIGNYTLNYNSYSQSYVPQTSGSCPITVFKRTDAKITWQSATSFKSFSPTLKVLVTDSNGKAISGQTVELTAGSETYTAKTSSSGYATFKTDLEFGNYKVKVKLQDTNSFASSALSKSVTVEISQYGRGLNVKDSSYYSSAYTKASSHCPVNNAKIKALVKSLTKGLTSKVQKARAIFNYVRDYVFYGYYYNTHKGALGTLKSGVANCVDQAHLLISMYRTAGFKARYVHGSCTFSDGRFGHVWTQVLIGKTWVVGDPISYKNYLGKINNWNTKTYTLHSRYLSLPF